jgi:hypothetical protein
MDKKQFSTNPIQKLAELLNETAINYEHLKNNKTAETIIKLLESLNKNV